MADDAPAGAGDGTVETGETAETDDEEANEDADVDRAHLVGMDDGGGCTEVWEHLAERRGEDGDDQSSS